MLHNKQQFLVWSVLFPLFLSCCQSIEGTEQRAKDNGDIYVQESPSISTSPPETEQQHVNWTELMQLCNASFSIPMEELQTFNTTGELPNIVDKTGMCFLRCMYEKSQLLENWQLNAPKIRLNIWPATGDTIEYCQLQGKSEPNACVRTYAIAKCLMIRAIVDARNKPMT